MRLALLALTLVGLELGACQHRSGDGCNVPPGIYFQLADRTGRVLTTSAADQLAASYLDANRVVQPIGPYSPQQVSTTGPAAPWFYADSFMALKNQQGIHTFFLSFGGKTDTLTLSMQDACGYHPAATFNGRPVSETPTDGTNPSYYRLRRAH